MLDVDEWVHSDTDELPAQPKHITSAIGSPKFCGPSEEFIGKHRVALLRGWVSTKDD